MTSTLGKRFAWTIAFALLAIAAYLGFWPVPIQAVAWTPPVIPGYTGAHAVNSKLGDLNLISLGAEAGPEHIVLARDNKLYTAVASGNIVRMQPDGSSQEVFVNTGGRVLGFDFDAAGNLIAADTIKGLLSISPDRKITMLTDQVDGEPILFADAVVVARSGKIYFSDASRRFAPKKWGVMEAALLDIFEHSSTGRVLEYDPAAKATRVVAGGLNFANGIALSSDEKSFFVSETGRFRVWKISTEAANIDVNVGSPQATVLLDNLPGAPDNLLRGLNGKIWLGLFGPRNAEFDATASIPFLRELMLRLPRALWPAQTAYGHVIAFTEDGTVVEDLQDPAGAYPETTGLTETPDRLYVHNLHNHVLGWRARAGSEGTPTK